MLSSIRTLVVVALAAGVMWHCGSERVTKSLREADEPIGQPLSKLAVQQHSSQAVVVATVQQDDAPVSGAMVAFSRAIAGQAAAYQWSGMTDETGQARVEIVSENATGYYRARASVDGSEIGSWSSIPVNGGYEVLLDLPIGGKARVMGSSRLASAGLTGEIPVGLVVSLTGRLALTGITMRHGFELAREEINRSSLLGGATLKFIIEDDGSTVEGAVAAYNKLIDQGGVSAILGPFTSSATQVVFPIAQENGVVAISPTSAARGLSALGDFVFRVSLTVDALLPGGVKTTQEKFGYQRVATIVNETDVFSQSSDAVLKEAFNENGVEVLTTETFQSGDTNFSEQLTRIKARNPDAIFISALPLGRTQIPIQARQLGIPFDIPFLVTLMTIDDVQNAGAAAEGAMSFTTWYSEADTPGNRAFVENYRAKFGTEPAAFAARSYAAAHILAQAIADAQSTESSAIRDALALIDMPTILGQFSFDAHGDAVHDPMVLIVRDGKFEPLQVGRGEARVLNVGFYAFFAPVSYSADPDPASPGFNTHLGYEADLLTALETRAEWVFARHPIAVWPDIWLQSAGPQYDIVGGGITILDSRTRDATDKQVVAFTSGHIAFRQSLLVRAEDAQRLASHGDLTREVRVGVLAGTTGEFRLLELTGLVDVQGVLTAGVRVETPQGTVVADGSADYVITAAGESPNLTGRQKLHPPSDTMPQVIYLGDEIGEAELLNALSNGSIDAIARGEIGNRDAAHASGNAFVVTALDEQIELGGFTLSVADAALASRLDEQINYLTDDRRIGYAEWLADPLVFMRRAEMWNP